MENEFDLEREYMIKTHKNQVKELEDMIETVKEEEKKSKMKPRTNIRLLKRKSEIEIWKRQTT